MAPTSRKIRTRAVVVVVVVEGLSGWETNERLSILPENKGFARLRREGTWHQELLLRQATTDGAAGMATLFTGLPPRDHGIVADEIIDSATRARVSILRDATSSTGHSLARLTAETTADRFRKEVPKAWIASVSFTPPGAELGGGRSPDVAIAVDEGKGAFVASGGSVPSWFHPAPDLQAIRREPWVLKDAEWIKAHVHTTDASAGEGDFEKIGIKFPHSFGKASTRGLRVSPAADAMVLDGAMQAIDAGIAAHGRDLDALIIVSLPSLDAIHRVFGPDSWEAHDALLRLDDSLSTFLGKLDERFTPSGYSVVLTSNHGTGRLPEADQIKNGITQVTAHQFGLDDLPFGQRINPSALADALRKSLNRELGPGDYISGIAAPYVYFTDALKKQIELEPLRVWRALAGEISPSNGIERFLLVHEGSLGRMGFEKGRDTFELIERSVKEGASGEIYLVPARGSFVDPSWVLGKGAGAGTPHLYDRLVPWLVRESDANSARSVIDATPRDVTDFDDSLSSLLGISKREKSPKGAIQSPP